MSQELLDAAKVGDLKKVQELLNQGVNAAYRDELGKTALYYAASLGHTALAKVLIELYSKMGVDINHSIFNTPVEIAMRNGHIEVVKLLLAHGAWYDLINLEAGGIQWDIVSLLFDVQDLFAIVDEGESGESRVSHKSLEQLLNTVASAINAGSIYRQRRGGTILHCAVNKGRFDVALRLLVANAKYDLKNSLDKTAVDLMLESPNPEFKNLGDILSQEDPAPYIQALGILFKIKSQTTESFGSEVPSLSELESLDIDALQPLLDQLIAILSTLKNTKLKSYICYEIGIQLVCRNLKVHYEGLVPIDAVLAYNLLTQVDGEDPVKYAQAQTMLDILCFERHVRLKKGPYYPDGPFIAVARDMPKAVTVEAQEVAQEGTRDEVQEEAKEDEEILERAMFYHRSRSGPENPHKETAVKLTAALLDPGLSIQGIAGFTQFSDLASLNRFFDAADQVQRQRTTLQQASHEMEKHIGKELIEAATKGDLKKVQELLDQGVKPDFSDELGYTALHWAAQKGRDEIVILLIDVYLKAGLNIAVQNIYGYNPLHCAVSMGRVGVSLALINAYIKTGVRMDMQDNAGMTALHMAARNDDRGYSHITRALLQAFLKTGGNIDNKNFVGRTALHVACENATVETVRQLLALGACFDSLDSSYKTPRQYLIDRHPDGFDHRFKPDVQAAESLLLKVQNLFEMTEKESKQSVEADLAIMLGMSRSLGSAINARSAERNGNTVIHLAVLNQQIDFVLSLLALNVDIHLKNNDNNTAVDLMRESPNPELRALGNLLQIKTMIESSYVSSDSNGTDTKENEAAFVSGEALQPFIDQINLVLPMLTNTKIKNDLCLELGMLLVRRRKLVHYEGLVPIDAVHAYNLLSQVDERNPEQYSQAQTMLDILCFERHVRLKKGPLYPDGPFVAVTKDMHKAVTVEVQEVAQEGMRDEVQEEAKEDEEILERAMFYHRSRSGPENPHKDTANKLAAALVDPGLSIQGMPGFGKFCELSSLNRFFDVVEQAHQQRNALQLASQDMGRQIAALEFGLAGFNTAKAVAPGLGSDSATPQAAWLARFRNT